MSRRTIVSALVGLLLVGAGSVPALADPLPAGEGTSVCLRTDSESGKRDGVCVFVPLGR